MAALDKILRVPNGVNDDILLEVCVPSCDDCISRHVSMCSALKDNEIHQLSEISQKLSKTSKQYICEEGEKADYLYNIREGCVRISKMLPDGRRQIIGFLFAGDFFGLSCADGYSYTAEAITDVDLCKMSRENILEKFNDIPALGQKIIDITQTELHAASEQMLLLGRKKAKEKLGTFLLSMNNKSLQSSNIPEDQIFLPMSRSDIADYLGLTIETVSRQFTILVKDNVISLDENPNVKILDNRQLELIASGA
ncbi:MAG: cyclic nucleotide-binding domain-containing protein [Kordiimonadaceae bacterium]|jgi:CRP/FNR family transcriptional regulator, anaerobic regulatory protein|nr:cyclic nucleotide-binding domain-containing protein [Kordiimonadaceae bacterium]MBT6035948.1 cyclic nucleotide-binding domain-containing protein [Kordiimonadaceae bacterium]MBT6329006.1 cyclic nucleotide-binding domain-containing protein [Kordiimonadaceae bacterium]MBT7583126.1 cyclic nucleotide-binding domain-containing protein [Kordiimonadaceae bacterium]